GIARAARSLRCGLGARREGRSQQDREGKGADGAVHERASCWIPHTLREADDRLGKRLADEDDPSGSGASSEPDAPLDEGDRRFVVAERQGRGPNLAIDADLQPDALPGLPLHAPPEKSLTVREIAAGEGVAAVIPDVVFGIALEKDLLGDLPLGPNVAAGDEHEARLDLLGRARLPRGADVY